MSRNNESVRRLRLQLAHIRRCTTLLARKALVQDFRRTEARCRKAGQEAAAGILERRKTVL